MPKVEHELSPTREAKRIVAELVRGYQAQGQPMASCPCGLDDGCRRCRAVDRAIERIADRLECEARATRERKA